MYFVQDEQGERAVTESTCPFLVCPHCGSTFQGGPPPEATDPSSDLWIKCDHCRKTCYVEFVETIVKVHLSTRKQA